MNYKIYISAAFIILILLALGGAYNTALVSEISEEGTALISADSFSPSFAKHRIGYDEVGINTYEVTITSDELKEIEGDLYSVIINKIADHGIRVYINDVYVYSDGDMEAGQANFKYGFRSFEVNKSLFKETNKLKIETYGLYKSGIETDGIIITDIVTGNSIVERLDIYGYKVMFFSIGFLLFSGIFVGIVYFMFGKEDITLLFCSLATVFVILYFQDYVNVTLPFSYLTFKKISLLGLFYGSTFYIMAASRYFDSKWLKWLMLTLAGAFTLVSLISKDMIQYKMFYDRFFLALLVLMGMAFIFSLVNLKNSEYAYLIVISFTALMMYAGVAIISDMLEAKFTINSPLVYIVVVAAMPLMIGVDTILQKREALSHEQLLRKLEFKNANTDSLTGAWNQRYLFSKLTQMEGESVLAIIDLDNFKGVNDEYGHLAGDEVLKHVSKVINHHLPENAECCRYGGDEFVVIGYQNGYHDFKIAMDDICKYIDNSSVIYDKSNIHVTVSIGVYPWNGIGDVNDALKYADKALYQSKEKGKNCVW